MTYVIDSIVIFIGYVSRCIFSLTISRWAGRGTSRYLQRLNYCNCEVPFWSMRLPFLFHRGHATRTRLHSIQYSLPSRRVTHFQTSMLIAYFHFSHFPFVLFIKFARLCYLIVLS